MNRNEYNLILAEMERGTDVADDVFEELVAFAKAKKIKRPVRAEPKPSKTVNKGRTCSADGCDRGAVAKRMCSKHHTAWWRAQDPARKARANEASKRWRERKRAEAAALEAVATEEARKAGVK